MCQVRGQQGLPEWNPVSTFMPKKLRSCIWETEANGFQLYIKTVCKKEKINNTSFLKIELEHHFIYLTEYFTYPSIDEIVKWNVSAKSSG